MHFIAIFRVVEKMCSYLLVVGDKCALKPELGNLSLRPSHRPKTTLQAWQAILIFHQQFCLLCCL